MCILPITALNIRNRKQAEINSKQIKREIKQTFLLHIFIPTGLFQSWPVFLTKFFMKEIWVRVAAHIVVHSCHDQCLKNISVVFFEFSLYFHNHYIVLDICNISIKLRYKNAGLIHHFQNYNKWELVEVSIRYVDDVQWLLPSSAGSKFPD